MSLAPHEANGNGGLGTSPVPASDHTSGSVPGTSSAHPGVGKVIAHEGSVGSAGGPAQGAPPQSSPYLSQSHPTSATAIIPPSLSLPSSSVASLPHSGAPLAQDPRAAPPYPPATHAPPPTIAPIAQASVSDAILVSGLPRDVTIDKLAKYFGEFGQLKMDRSKDPPAPLIQILRDPVTQQPKGEARIIWDNPEHAPLAVSYFNGKHWPGVGTIRVELSATPQVQHLPPHMMPTMPHPYPVHSDPNAPYGSSVPPVAGYGVPHGYPQQAYDPRLVQQQPQQHPPQQALPQGYTMPNAAYSSSAYDPRLPPSYAPPQDPYAQPAAPSAGYSPYSPAYAPTGQTSHTNIPGAAPPHAMPPQQYQPQMQQQQQQAMMYMPQQPQYGYAQPPMQQPMYPAAHEDPTAAAVAAYAAHVPPLQQNVPTGMPRVFKGKGGAARVGDWVCPSCGNNNFAWRSTCKQCTVPRPAHAQVVNQDEEESPDAGARPGGPRGPQAGRAQRGHHDDWICPRCGFKNFSKREQCHDCSAPRPNFGSHGPVRSGGQRPTRPY